MAALRAARGRGAIAPGPVLKPDDLSEEENDTAIKKTLLGRWGTPKDIGRCISAILRGDFPFSTGQVFDVDGGFHLRTL